ncbi:MAG: hypothetical protein D6805_07130 [Planctomycetota bacterium]|nr:MAG: hypothetical protein D6805_07130 [Planctomycetota bacterium]
MLNHSTKHNGFSPCPLALGRRVGTGERRWEKTPFYSTYKHSNRDYTPAYTKGEGMCFLSSPHPGWGCENRA